MRRRGDVFDWREHNRRTVCARERAEFNMDY